ncbi:hypothetical protein [Pseudoalteromonas xiamenensis]
MNQRSSLVQHVLARLTSGLTSSAAVSLLSPSVEPDLTQKAQLLVHPVSEHQASDLQAKGTDKGVSYGPVQNKNLYPNPLNRRLLTCHVEIRLKDADGMLAFSRLDTLISECEALLDADETPNPWQHFIPLQVEFVFNEDSAQVNAKALLVWQFYYQIAPPQEALSPAIKEVYLGPQGQDHWLIATVKE